MNTEELKIRKKGDPVLSAKSEPVKEDEIADVILLADEAAKLMQDNQGAGLAANQVGDLRRWFVMLGIGLLINPSWKPTSSSKIKKSYEGCLSDPTHSLIRGRTYLKKRHRVIRAEWVDQWGNPKKKVFRGFAAFVFQHECDHLDGVNVWD